MKTKRLKLFLLCALSLFVSCSQQNKFSSSENESNINAVFNGVVNRNDALDIEGLTKCISGSGEFLWLEDGIIQYTHKSLLVMDITIRN